MRWARQLTARAAAGPRRREPCGRGRGHRASPALRRPRCPAVRYLESVAVASDAWPAERTRVAAVAPTRSREAGVSPHTALHARAPTCFRARRPRRRRRPAAAPPPRGDGGRGQLRPRSEPDPFAAWAVRGASFATRSGAGTSPARHLDALGGLGADVHVAHGMHLDAATGRCCASGAPPSPCAPVRNAALGSGTAAGRRPAARGQPDRGRHRLARLDPRPRPARRGPRAAAVAGGPGLRRRRPRARGCFTPRRFGGALAIGRADLGMLIPGATAAFAHVTVERPRRDRPGRGDRALRTGPRGAPGTGTRADRADWTAVTRAALDKQPAEVAAMFDAVARRYDLTNSVLSLGPGPAVAAGHPARCWHPQPGSAILDLAAGTGGEQRSARPAPGARVVAADFSLGMLRVGAPPRAGRATVVAADALALPFADAVLRRGDDLLRAAQRRRPARRPARVAPRHPSRRPAGGVRVQPAGVAPFRTVYVEYLMRALPAVARVVPAARTRTSTSRSRSGPGRTRPGSPADRAGRLGAGGLADLNGGIVALHRRDARPTGHHLPVARPDSATAGARCDNHPKRLDSTLDSRASQQTR